MAAIEEKLSDHLLDAPMDLSDEDTWLSNRDSDCDQSDRTRQRTANQSPDSAALQVRLFRRFGEAEHESRNYSGTCQSGWNLLYASPFSGTYCCSLSHSIQPDIKPQFGKRGFN
jgi:hypothetical protein